MKARGIKRVGWELLGSPPALPLLFLLALSIYLLTAWIILPKNVPWSPDEGAKYLQLTNLRASTGRLSLKIPYQGAVLDPQLEFALSEHPKDLLRVAGKDLALERLPIFTMAVWPFYNAFGAAGLYILPAIFGALCSVLPLGMLLKDQRRILMWVLIAFGSPIFVYSVLFWEHTLATGTALAGAWLILSGLQSVTTKRAYLALRWLLGISCLSLAIYLRLETILFAFAFLAACWLLMRADRKWVLLAGLALLLSLLPYPALHRLLFEGQALPVNARYLNLPFAYLRHARWGAVPDLLIGPAEEQAIETGWLGVIWSLAAILAVACSLLPTQRKAVKILARVSMVITTIAAAYLLLSPTPYRSAHGLLFTTPWVLVGFTRAAVVWRQNEPHTKIILTTIFLGLTGYTLAMVGFRGSSPQGGLEWGARFALTFYPLLALIAGWQWPKQQNIDRMISAALILLGIGFQLRGIATIRTDKITNAALNQAIMDLPDKHVLTDLWWLPLNAATIEPGTAIYSLKSPEEGRMWITTANQHGVNEFALVTLDHAFPTNINIHIAAVQPEEVAGIQILEVIHVEDLIIYRLEIEQLTE